MSGFADLLDQYGATMLSALSETGYMLAVSLVAAVLVGLPLGVTVYLTQRGGLAENRPVWIFADSYINIVRSFPFLVLVVFLIPFTRFVMGTSFGTQAATLPLSIVAIAIYGRLTEQILREIPPGIPMVAESMGQPFPKRFSNSCCRRRVPAWCTHSRPPRSDSCRIRRSSGWWARAASVTSLCVTDTRSTTSNSCTWRSWSSCLQSRLSDTAFPGGSTGDDTQFCLRDLQRMV